MKRAVQFVIPLLALFAFAVNAFAQSGGPYTLVWSNLAGGGSSGGGSYEFAGTVGQPAVGQMSGGAYALIGGYWAASIGTNPLPPPTNTPARTNSPTQTRTPSKTTTSSAATQTPTRTVTPSVTSTSSSTGTNTPTRTLTATLSRTPTNTPDSSCARAPDKPKLKKPVNNSVVAILRPKLRWKSAACAATYKVVVKDATGKKVDKKGGLTVLEYKTKKLSLGVMYKWRVLACKPGFKCAKSASWNFTLQ
jgi:hypothetical protein